MNIIDLTETQAQRNFVFGDYFRGAVFVLYSSKQDREIYFSVEVKQIVYCPLCRAMWDDYKKEFTHINRLYSDKEISESLGCSITLEEILEELKKEVLSCGIVWRPFS